MSPDLPAPGPQEHEPSRTPSEAPLDPLEAVPGYSLEVADLRDRIEAAKKAETSYSLSIMVGMSPIGLFLLVGFILEGGVYLYWIAALVAAFVVQFVRWRRAEAEVERLEGELQRILVDPNV